MKLGPSVLVPLAGVVGLGVVGALALRPTPPLVPRFGSLPPAGEVVAAGLDAGATTLVGTLTDGRGVPVVAAGILAVRGGRPVWTASDEEGRFELPGLDPGSVRLAVVHEDFAAHTHEAIAGAGPVVLDLGDRLAPLPELEEPEASDLAGRVASRTEKDLAGFELAILPLGPAERPGTGIPRRVLLDASGSFHVDALARGEYELLLLPPWARGGSWPDLLSPLDVPPLRYSHPPADDPARALELEAVSGEIAGRAQSADGRAPLEAGMVLVAPAPAGDEGRGDSRRFPAVRTDEQGIFRVPLVPPGRYVVEIVAGADRRRTIVVVPESGSVDPEL